MPELDERDARFADLFATMASPLRRTAYLLCGDWHHAEDLVQTSFAKTYAAWPRMRNPQAAERYLRQTLTRTFIDHYRRSWRGEHPTEQLPEAAAPDSHDPHDRILIRQALDQLPPKQRATLVLRFFDDLTVSETAAVLGCTQGTVKSNTSRGLDQLRPLLPDHLMPSQELIP